LATTVVSTIGFRYGRILVFSSAFGVNLHPNAPSLADLIGHGNPPTVAPTNPDSAGEKTGPNPTDRGKAGTKKSLLVEADGGPLSVVLDGANRHDCKLLEDTINAVVIERPEPEDVEQHLCLDKGYDNPSGEDAAEEAGYITHIRRIGEEKLDKRGRKRRKAHRWVVERTLAWLQKCRAILIRYDVNWKNYLGLIQLACALLWFRRTMKLLRISR
jgi:putative transposase